MFQRRIPEWVRHAPTPSVQGFGILAACDASARSILMSVFPLVIYRTLGDPQAVSQVFLLVGCASLFTGLLIPRLIQHLPRRWVFTFGAALYVFSASLAIVGGPSVAVVALLLYTLAAVIVFVCLNAYVLDYVAQVELGRCETFRMFYSAIAWCVGPALGVWLMTSWFPAAFVLSAIAGAVLIVTFWWMRLGDGKLIRRARRPAANPLAYLGRFFAQPRLVAGWLFAVFRSCAWWIYVVYLPIFAIEQGMGERLGGTALSVTNAMLFATPLMLRWVQRHSVRYAVRRGFLLSAILFIAATLLSGWPWAAVACLFAASIFMVLLDICAGLPFLMAVKPSERTEMSAVYSIYRDFSGILTPGVAWLVLLVAPVAGLFAAGGVGLLASWAIASRLHPRLGISRATRREPGQVEPAL